ncbi:MAG: lycopene cyclase family protein [Chitinophagaceae bacterium]|nr:lycopene cyclase family protein [Chitinophagaceae bacterium]
MNRQFDYIIAGAGGAGLSLLMRILDEPTLLRKKILLIDRGPKTANDRTWCFWEKGNGYFEETVYRRWDKLRVKHPKGNINLSMNGYSYKMIRSVDFYQHCFERIRNAGSRVQLVYGSVTEIKDDTGEVTVDGFTYQGGIVFSSILLAPPQLKPTQHYLLQHFRGWWIETAQDSFDPDTADLMDFRVPQEHGCTFVYVMPLSPKKALVEYTLFSEKELDSEQYDSGLKNYIQQNLGLDSYKISEVENGVIPMTNYRFPGKQGKVIFLGTAGGQTKASTGYTFSNMQKHAAALVRGLVLNNPQLLAGSNSSRFLLYDSILLRVLKEAKMPGADVLFSIFKRNRASTVFRFLDNDSEWYEEAGIMIKAPWRVFTSAAIAEIM